MPVTEFCDGESQTTVDGVLNEDPRFRNSRVRVLLKLSHHVRQNWQMRVCISRRTFASLLPNRATLGGGSVFLTLSLFPGSTGELRSRVSRRDNELYGLERNPLFGDTSGPDDDQTERDPNHGAGLTNGFKHDRRGVEI